MGTKYRIAKIGCIAFAMLLAGCGSEKQQQEESVEVQRTLIGTYEAETGKTIGNGRVEEDADGNGFVVGFEQDGDGCSITIHVDEAGFYDLEIMSASLGGHKENFVSVDDLAVGRVTNDSEVLESVPVKRVYMEAGDHEVSITKYWGYIKVDSLSVYTSLPFDESIFEVSAKLCNPNADDSAKRLMSFLVDNYGKNTLSGQYCDTGLYGKETACIWTETGKFPAVIGLDMMDYSPSAVEHGAQGTSVDRALEAWEAGAIVTFCWHWDAPSKYHTGNWYSTFYKENVNLSLDKVMNGEDPEGYELLISDMDAIAAQLHTLQYAGVPVLWRPLHEASGGWFWWGDCSPQSYIDFYRLMYDRFTNEWGLNNLIWVWNGQSKDWYPGDDVVDIVGIDIYPEAHEYGSNINQFLEVYEYADSKKMLTLSENGTMTDPDLALRDRAMWSYFGTWGGEFVAESFGMNFFSEKYTEIEMLKKIYNHENIITFDELPDLKNYPIREDAK